MSTHTPSCRPRDYMTIVIGPILQYNKFTLQLYITIICCKNIKIINIGLTVYTKIIQHN